MSLTATETESLFSDVTILYIYIYYVNENSVILTISRRVVKTRSNLRIMNTNITLKKKWNGSSSTYMRRFGPNFVLDTTKKKKKNITITPWNPGSKLYFYIITDCTTPVVGRRVIPGIINLSLKVWNYYFDWTEQFKYAGLVLTEE